MGDFFEVIVFIFLNFAIFITLMKYLKYGNNGYALSCLCFCVSMIFFLYDNYNANINVKIVNGFDTEEEAYNFNYDSFENKIPVIFDLNEVGDKKKFDYLSVDSNHNYEIGYFDNENTLKWIPIGEDVEVTVKKNDNNLNYIERVNNIINSNNLNGEDKYTAVKASFVIYIKDGFLGSKDVDSLKEKISNQIIN